MALRSDYIYRESYRVQPALWGNHHADVSPGENKFYIPGRHYRHQVGTQNNSFGGLSRWCCTNCMYLLIRSWAHECLAEVRSSSRANLRVIPRKRVEALLRGSERCIRQNLWPRPLRSLSSVPDNGRIFSWKGSQTLKSDCKCKSFSGNKVQQFVCKLSVIVSDVCLSWTAVFSVERKASIVKYVNTIY